jgi:hypothetical protein
MGDPATARGESRRRDSATHSLGADDRALDDDWAQQFVEGGHHHHYGDRGRGAALVEARETIVEFQAMIRNKTDVGLTKWIAAAHESLVASFASGVAKDEPAVRAAITLPWSNGQTEGQITKLKLVKRQMYGRAKIDLLQARLIGVPA